MLSYGHAVPMSIKTQQNQLQLRTNKIIIQIILHLHSRPVRIHGWVRALAVPGPFLL